MPDAEGKLTKDEAATAFKWFADKSANKPCSMCGGQHWDMDDNLVRLDTWHPRLQNGPLCFPSVVLMCTTCGHMAFFSAVHMGIMTPPAGMFSGITAPEKEVSKPESAQSEPSRG